MIISHPIPFYRLLFSNTCHINRVSGRVDVGIEGSIAMQEGFLATAETCTSLDLETARLEFIEWEQSICNHHKLRILDLLTFLPIIIFIFYI